MYLHEQHCYTCDRITSHQNSDCSECAGRQHAEKERLWQALPLDEKIEALRKRIQALEGRGWLDC